MRTDTGDMIKRIKDFFKREVHVHKTYYQDSMVVYRGDLYVLHSTTGRLYRIRDDGTGLITQQHISTFQHY